QDLADAHGLLLGFLLLVQSFVRVGAGRAAAAAADRGDRDLFLGRRGGGSAVGLEDGLAPGAGAARGRGGGGRRGRGRGRDRRRGRFGDGAGGAAELLAHLGQAGLQGVVGHQGDDQAGQGEGGGAQGRGHEEGRGRRGRFAAAAVVEAPQEADGQRRARQL